MYICCMCGSQAFTKPKLDTDTILYLYLDKYLCCALPVFGLFLLGPRPTASQRAEAQITESINRPWPVVVSSNMDMATAPPTAAVDGAEVSADDQGSGSGSGSWGLDVEDGRNDDDRDGGSGSGSFEIDTPSQENDTNSTVGSCSGTVAPSPQEAIEQANTNAEIEEELEGLGQQLQLQGVVLEAQGGEVFGDDQHGNRNSNGELHQHSHVHCHSDSFRFFVTHKHAQYKSVYMKTGDHHKYDLSQTHHHHYHTHHHHHHHHHHHYNSGICLPPQEPHDDPHDNGSQEDDGGLSGLVASHQIPTPRPVMNDDDSHGHATVAVHDDSQETQTFNLPSPVRLTPRTPRPRGPSVALPDWPKRSRSPPPAKTPRRPQLRRMSRVVFDSAGEEWTMIDGNDSDK